MEQSKVQESPKVISKVVENTGDATAGLLTLGVISEVVPVILGVLGVAWFCLRIINFIRVNFYHKKPWLMG